MKGEWSMKNKRMKEKVKDFVRNKDLEFLMKGWEHPESNDTVKTAYDEKFNTKEETEDGRTSENSTGSFSEEKAKEDTTSEEG